MNNDVVPQNSTNNFDWDSINHSVTMTEDEVIASAIDFKIGTMTVSDQKKKVIL